MSGESSGCCAVKDVLLPGAWVDDAAAAVAGDWSPLAQAELGPLDAPQHHRPRLPAAPLVIHCIAFCLLILAHMLAHSFVQVPTHLLACSIIQ